GRSRRWRYHQSLPLASDNLAWSERRTQRPQRKPSGKLEISADGSRPSYEICHSGDHRTDWNDNGFPAVGSATQHLRGFLRRDNDYRLRLPVRHGLVSSDRRDRLVIESNLRHDRSDTPSDLSGLSAFRLDRTTVLRHG